MFLSLFIPFTFKAQNNSQKDTPCLALFILNTQKMPKKIHQPWSWKHSSKKPNNRPLSWAESNTNNTILKLIVKRVINYKEASKNNNMVYGYYTKLLKQYENFIPWLNKNY